MDHLCYLLCIPACLFIDAMWSPAGKGLTHWLSFVISNCMFVTFPCSIMGQVWYLIVSIPDLCPLSYHSVLYMLEKVLFVSRHTVSHFSYAPFFRAHNFRSKYWNRTFSVIIYLLTFYLFDDIEKISESLMRIILLRQRQF